MNKPYLKSMDIHGFRSFPNQTHIDFSPKINAILGAHETGKTNILDAIKWCLYDNRTSNYWDRNNSSNDSDINFIEVQMTFGIEENNDSDTILRRRITINNDNRIVKSECFINEEPVVEGLFSERLFAQGFLKQETELGRMFEGRLFDTKYSDGFEISISRFLPTPLCLIDDSISPSDETLNQIITSMIKGLSNTSQCIVVSNMRQIAMEAERMIGVTMEENISKVMELKRFL